MATKSIPLDELKGIIVADLFAFSGSKLVEINDWTNEQLDEIAKFPNDTFHKQGYLVQAMIDVFAKTEKKEKVKALCHLAGRLWYVHNILHEQNIDLRNEITRNIDKITDIEEELLALLTEKNELNERVIQLQQERESDDVAPSGDLWSENYRDRTRLQIITDLEDRKAEIAVCNEQLTSLRNVYKAQADVVAELQSQARAERRRSNNDDLKIQELEAELRNLKTSHPSDCPGDCKAMVEQLNNNLLKADEEIERLVKEVKREKDRYWEAEEVVQERDVDIANRNRFITQLERENDLLIKRFADCQQEVQTIRTRLMKEAERKEPSPQYPTTELVKPRSKPDLGERTEEGEYYQQGARPKERVENPGNKERKYASKRPHSSSEDESSPEWAELPERKIKNKGGEIKHQERPKKGTKPRATAKSIKALQNMIQSFSKSDKNKSILEHLSLYQRLMQTLEMDSDMELKTHLSWTFASDSQAFFLSVDSLEYDTWADYRSEVIKYFSPHRNTHEALRYALNLKCEPNQHPRDYLQLLKNAFAQVQKGVDVETKQFRNAYFYGLPMNIRTQLARDYDDDRSIDWIYKQAKSVFDVCRTNESAESKDKPKPSKVCEINQEKELSFEAGGNKSRTAPKEKERNRNTEQKAPSAPAKEPEPVGNISPRYKGNNPIPNFVYKPKEKPSDTRPGGDPERNRAKENTERESYYPKEREYTPKNKPTYYPQYREREAQDYYRQGGYDRSDYQSDRREPGNSREWQETRPYSSERDQYYHWNTRPQSPRQPARTSILEDQIHDLNRQFQKLLTKDSGLSPRVQAAASGETKESDTPRPAQ